MNIENNSSPSLSYTAKELAQVDLTEYFKYHTEAEYEFTSRMGDCEAEILNIFNSVEPDKNKYYNFISAMNSGKTYSMIDICNRNKINAIIAVPLQIIAKQKTSEYKKNCAAQLIECNVYSVHGKRMSSSGITESFSREKIESILRKNNYSVFVTVFDSLKKFEYLEAFKPEDFLLIIDEAHNLSTQYNFRSDIINFIADYKRDFKKVIYLTGTPEIALPYCNKTYSFRKKDSSTTPQKVNIVSYNGNNTLDKYWYLFSYLISDRSGGIKVVFHDNIDALERLGRSLSRYGIPEETIMIINSKKKDTPEYFALEDEEEIPQHIEYLLTTRMLADGANIRTNVKSIYCLDLTDFWIKRQFIGRFRNQLENVYDLVNFTNRTEKSSSYLESKNLEAFYRTVFNESLGVVQKVKQSNQTYKEYNKHRPKQIKKNLNRNRHIYYSMSTNGERVSSNSILSEIINNLNQMLHSTFQSDKDNGEQRPLLQSFYTQIANSEVSYEEISAPPNQLITYEDFVTKWNHLNIFSLSKSPEILHEHIKEFLWSYAQNSNPALIYSGLADSTLLNIFFLEITLFKERYLECLEDPNSKKIINRIIDLAMDGFRGDLITTFVIVYAKLLNDKSKIKSIESFFRKLRWYLNFSIVRKYPEVMKVKHPFFDYHFRTVDLVSKTYLKNRRANELERKELLVKLGELVNENPSNKYESVKTLFNDIENALFKLSRSNSAERKNKSGKVVHSKQEYLVKAEMDFFSLIQSAEGEGCHFVLPSVHAFLQIRELATRRLKRVVQESVNYIYENKLRFDSEKILDRLNELHTKLDDKLAKREGR